MQRRYSPQSALPGLQIAGFQTRRHLFARVKFDLASIQRWVLFPDPSTSPVHHSRILILCRFPIIGIDASIHSFRRILGLKMDTSWRNDDDQTPRSVAWIATYPSVPLHTLSISPTLRDLESRQLLPSPRRLDRAITASMGTPRGGCSFNLTKAHQDTCTTR